MKMISIVAPMYNESGVVKQYCERTINVLSTLGNNYEYEIVLVNDGSSDMTLTEMQQEQRENPQHIAVVSLTRNFGLEGAVQAGLDHARGDAVIVMDADLQDPPELIPKLLEKWESGIDVVHAVRTSRVSDSFFKRKTADMYYRLISGMAGKVRIPQGAANYKLLSRRALEILQILPERNKVFRVTVPYIGLKTDCVGYGRDQRYAGKTKYNIKSMIAYALDGITGVTVTPLRKIRWAVFVSMLFFLASLLGAIFTDGAARLTALIYMGISMMTIVLSVCIAVMAEYLAQVFMEVKERPISLTESYQPAEQK